MACEDETESEETWESFGILELIFGKDMPWFLWWTVGHAHVKSPYNAACHEAVFIPVTPKVVGAMFTNTPIAAQLLQNGAA